jgi:hypothetical protein
MKDPKLSKILLLYYKPAVDYVIFNFVDFSSSQPVLLYGELLLKKKDGWSKI